MKILLFTDGSAYSEMAISNLEALRLPSQTQVTAMTVVPEQTFLGGITFGTLKGGSSIKKTEQEQRSVELLQGAIKGLSTSRLKVDRLVQWGNPAEKILRVAEERDTSLIVLGAKGVADSPPFLLGGITQKVMKYARASVLLARNKPATIRRVLFATDGSKYSEAVAQFLMRLPLPRRCQIIVVTSLQSHIEALVSMPTLDLETNQRLIAQLKAAEEEQARQLIAKSKEQLETKGYKTVSLVIRGGAAESILKAAEECDPDIIALGSKGLTGIEQFLLGSVAERVARYARCSVLIGRLPATENRARVKASMA